MRSRVRIVWGGVMLAALLLSAGWVWAERDTASQALLASRGNTITTVDRPGNVGQFTALARGADGLPVISYLDNTNLNLKVLHCGNPACSSGNISTTVDSAGFVGLHSSIALGADNLPVISYLDYTNANLKVLHCGNAACSSGNTVTIADSTGTVNWITAIAIGANYLPVISYFDDTNDDLKVLHCGTMACTSGNTATAVDSVGSVGRDSFIAIGADHLPLISYLDETNTNLKVLHCGNATCTNGNTATTVDSTGNVGEYSSITIGADALPVISYFDATNGDLKVLHCGNAACSSVNTVTTADSAGTVGYYTSIALGVDSLPVVSYSDATNGDLKVLHCGNTACSSGNTVAIVDRKGEVGDFSSLALGVDSLPVVSYYDSTNGDLKVLLCGTVACEVRLYLPLALQSHEFFFEGPLEAEDNDVYTSANGPLRAGRDYTGIFDDEKDFYSLHLSGTGNIVVTLSRPATPSPTALPLQLQLLYLEGNQWVVADSQTGSDTTGRQVTYAEAPARWYYIYVNAGTGTPTNQAYTLQVTY